MNLVRGSGNVWAAFCTDHYKEALCSFTLALTAQDRKRERVPLGQRRQEVRGWHVKRVPRAGCGEQEGDEGSVGPGGQSEQRSEEGVASFDVAESLGCLFPDAKFWSYTWPPKLSGA